uniref:R13L1/DRL21-like LRR repeat region domain-containing protein n=1 Tax=Solanum lycopersicum TaxID=4081 RepID=A0A3Q7JQG6_SOLLC
MENLINLRHLDTTGTSLLKMPLHPSKLKNLHVLVGFEFILGGCNDLRMVDLGELRNLHGFISVLELQNVVDRREALKANMMIKEHVEMLSLEWSESIADSSQTEGDILEKLQPNTNIKELEIAGYGGTKLPN